MHTLTTLSVLWIIALAVFVALMVYRAHLTQHETDELFLDDAADQSFRKEEHDEIVRRVNFLQPFCQGTGGLTALLTVAILGLQIAQALPYVHF
jgi:hypothetical protein